LEKKVNRSSLKFYDKVLANPDLYQLLCANCNALKRLDNDEMRGNRDYGRSIAKVRVISGKKIGCPPGANANAKKTHCKRNHPFDEENTYLIPGGGRRCLKCKKILRKEGGY
jgi:hypothetical protein